MSGKRLLPIIAASFFTSAHALSVYQWAQTSHLLLSGSVGGMNTSNTSNSQTFPIQDPAVDEFYKYSASRASQTTWWFDGFLALENEFIPNWRLQAGLDYNQTSPISMGGSLLQGTDTASANSYHYSYSVTGRQLLFAGKFLYLYHEKYHPYIFAGLGASYNKAFGYYVNALPFTTFTRMYADNTAAAFSYAAGIGIDADIFKNIRLGVGYRFADYGSVQLGQGVIDTTNVSGTLSQSHLYANEILAQLTVMIT